jgi:hypothetical protein
MISWQIPAGETQRGRSRRGSHASAAWALLTLRRFFSSTPGSAGGRRADTLKKPVPPPRFSPHAGIRVTQQFQGRGLEHHGAGRDTDARAA